MDYYTIAIRHLQNETKQLFSFARYLIPKHQYLSCSIAMMLDLLKAL